MKKFLTAFFVYTALALADGGLTLYNTPDLEYEGNPLVSRLGLGWAGLIISNLAFLALLFFICRFAFYKYQTFVADVPDMKAYISQMFYNRPDRFKWFFYKLPENRKPALAAFCFAIYFGILAGRVTVVSEWIAVTLGADMDGYFNFCSAFLFGRFDIAVSVLVAIVMLFVWFVIEYKKSRKTVERRETESTTDE